MTTQELKLKKIELFIKGIFGFAAVVFAFAALIYTTSPAQADAPATTTATGKILMHQNSFVHKGYYYYHVLVWNTESGKSKIYIFNADKVRLVKTSYQLPSSPLY